MSSQKSLPGGMPEQMRRRMEDDLRRRLSCPTAQMNEQELKIAEQALASVDMLERAYLKDRNPIHVWDAILQIGFAWQTLGRSIVFPPWILAYVFRASAEIMGTAVNRPKLAIDGKGGSRHRPVPPTQNPDGSMNSFSDYFRGVTATQRAELAMEALGFRGVRGTNPFEQAYRERAARDWVRHIDAELARGRTTAIAIHDLDDPALKRVQDSRRKIRRERRRLRGES